MLYQVELAYEPHSTFNMKASLILTIAKLVVFYSIFFHSLFSSKWCHLLSYKFRFICWCSLLHLWISYPSCENIEGIHKSNLPHPKSNFPRNGSISSWAFLYILFIHLSYSLILNSIINWKSTHKWSFSKLDQVSYAIFYIIYSEWDKKVHIYLLP